MFRLGIITKKGFPIGKTFNTKKEAEDFVLDIADKEGIKYYKILDKKTGEIVDKGKEI